MTELGKSLDPSQIIGNRYRVECCIASGAETSVVGAIDCATGKRVALKTWDGPTSEQEVAAVQCFVRAANRAGLFENPHVVEVYGTELGDTTSYIVSEWLQGSTLARELERVGRLSVHDALRHVLPCMRAVVEAHAAGVIHGDIRPAHIFLCRATRHLPERSRVFDFGRGSPGFHELRLPARVVVDEFCRYTPPELLCGADLDARSDVYGFGLLLYECITGERIFVEEDLFDLLREIERGPKRAIGDVTQTMPRALTEVLYRAMAVRPEDRYQELGTFLNALLPFAETVVSHRRATNVSTDQPVFALAGSARAHWIAFKRRIRQHSRMSPLLSGAALMATVLGLGHLAFRSGADTSQTDSPTRAVTSVHAAQATLTAVAPQPEPEPDLIFPEPFQITAPEPVVADRTQVATQTSERRTRARSERRQVASEVQPAPEEPEAPPPEGVTPLDRMQLQ